LTKYSSWGVRSRQPDSLPVTFRGDAATPITWRTTRAGQFTWTNVSGDAREAGLPATFTTFCIDGLQTVTPGRGTTFTDFTSALNANPFGGTTSAMGVDRANLLTQFWNQFGPADNVGGFSSAVDAAAFQLAVWEIVYDATPAGNGISVELASGKFQVGPTAQSAAPKASPSLPRGVCAESQAEAGRHGAGNR
jgi:hypothetical protein